MLNDACRTRSVESMNTYSVSPSLCPGLELEMARVRASGCNKLCTTCTAKQQNEGKGEVFYGQEPPSGESTTTECGVNYHYLQ